MNEIKNNVNWEKRYKDLVEAVQNETNNPSVMRTPIGILPINSEGMRKLSDALARQMNGIYYQDF